MRKRRLLFLSSAVATALLADAASQGIRFREDVYPILEKAGCDACHNPNGVASVTRLQFPEQGSPEARIEEFGDSLRRFVDLADPENSLLLKKPTNRVPHVGGKRIAPGSSDEAVLRAWVRRLATVPSLSAGSQPAPKESPVLRRLTHSQYDNTVRDLLGDIADTRGLWGDLGSRLRLQQRPKWERARLPAARNSCRFGLLLLSRPVDDGQDAGTDQQ